MSVTNNIRNNVIYLKGKGWFDEQITNEEIIEKLKKEEKEGFLSFSYRLLDLCRCEKKFNRKYNKIRQ